MSYYVALKRLHRKIRSISPQITALQASGTLGALLFNYNRDTEQVERELDRLICQARS